MTEPVSAPVQLAVRPALVKAGGHHLIGPRRTLRFKQPHIAISQRVSVRGVIACLQQLLALSGLDHGQVSKVALRLFADGQQQPFEIGQQLFSRGLVKKAFVVRQVQAQRIAGVHHHRHRVVGVSTGAVRLGADLLGTADHCAFDRGILVHKQAVENRLALFQRAACLNLQQRQMFMFTQRQVVLKHALQPLTHRYVLPGPGQAHTQRDAVDKQAHGVLHLRAVDRASCYRDAKQHVIQSTVTLQYQCPCRLGQGVDGQFKPLGQFTQGPSLANLKVGIHIADIRHPALTARRSIKRQRRGLLKTCQLSCPCEQGFTRALLLQPLDKVAIPRSRRQVALAAVEGKKVLQQQ